MNPRNGWWNSDDDWWRLCGGWWRPINRRWVLAIADWPRAVIGRPPAMVGGSCGIVARVPAAAERFWQRLKEFAERRQETWRRLKDFRLLRGCAVAFSVSLLNFTNFLMACEQHFGVGTAGVNTYLNLLFLNYGLIHHLRKLPTSLILKLVLEGRRIAFGASRKRKVRTPQGMMPRNSGLAGDILGRKAGRLFDGKCHRKLNRRRPFEAVRVKRWCKRPPREAQATRHGKPHRVQGQIGNPGAARSAFRESETGFGYRSLRQMILSARKGADRIRLTALPKPFCFRPQISQTGAD